MIIIICSKALRKTAFAEIFVFASFGNVHFSKIRVGTSCSSFFRTRPDSRKLVPTRSDPNFCKKTRFFANFVFVSFGNSLLTKFSKVTKKWHSTRLVSTRENSFRLETRLKSSECRALICSERWSSGQLEPLLAEGCFGFHLVRQKSCLIPNILVEE